MRRSALLAVLSVCAVASLLYLSIAGPLLTAAQVRDDIREKALADRVGDRAFPSVFQTWAAGFTNRGDLGGLEEWALHDLSWGMAWEYKLVWDDPDYPGLAAGFTPGSIALGLEQRRRLLELNPNMVLMISLYYRDAPGDWFPEDSNWWLRDENGDRVVGFEGEGGYVAYLLDYSNKGLRQQVAKRARACVRSGVVDGVMLDWWNDDSRARIKLLKAVRRAVGKDALIIVNTNQFKRPGSAKFINGCFMECPPTTLGREDWDTFRDTLRWAETSLRRPTVNCFLTMPEGGVKSARLMRATYAFALTFSDAYAMYSLCGVGGRVPHYHEWFDFLGDSLGRPLEELKPREDGAYWRKYERGYVVFNPVDNIQVTILLSRSHTNAMTGSTSREHDLDPEDGAILVRK